MITNLTARRVLLPVAMLLCGCALPQRSEEVKTRDDSLVPVNLLLNSGGIVDLRTAEALMHLQRQVSGSGLFAGVHIGISPQVSYALVMDANIDCSLGVVEGIAAVAASLTLFLIPHTETCSYGIKAAFFKSSELLATRVYSIRYKKTIQLFGRTQLEGDKQGLNAVYGKMMEDCLKNPPLPRAKSLKPPANV